MKRSEYLEKRERYLYSIHPPQKAKELFDAELKEPKEEAKPRKLPKNRK